MQEKFRKFSDKVPPVIKKLLKIVEIRFILCAVVTVIFAEILSVGFGAGLTYPFRHPAAFLCAIAILFFFYSFSSFFPCRLGIFIILECFWIALAITNKVLLSFRINPLSAVDFKIIRTAFTIISVYLSVFEIILIFTSIAAAIALAIVVIIKLPKKKPNFKRAVIFFLLGGALSFASVVSTVSIYSSNMRTMRLPDVYKEYGFVYSLSVSVSDRGISRPSGYSEQHISNIINNGSTQQIPSDILNPPETNSENDSGATPIPVAPFDKNVIFVQLESFFDPYLINGITLSEDPSPNFRNLTQNYPSGILDVPVAGGGTVNTEFEVLCGIPISVFGIGEYPYETYLTQSPCESLAYYFRNAGMATHALHNHSGTFYSRFMVMENVGFDTFTPVEYMTNVKRNSNDWAKDKIMTDEIIGALSSTKTPDFVYAISVQAHGKYVTVPGDYGSVKVTGSYPEDRLSAMEYYVNQIKDTDIFIGELINAVEKLGEDTVIVFYGDHQPSLDLTTDQLKVDSVYETEYVIWSNCGIEAKDCDLNAYRLGAHTLSLMGIDGGVITRYHNTKANSATYFEDLSSLAYDILMGQKFAYGGSFPYAIPETRYGWRDIKATGAYIKNETLFVIGENFTESSVIYVGGRRRDTIFINENLIVTDNLSAAADVKIAQIAESGYLFSEIPCKMIDIPE